MSDTSGPTSYAPFARWDRDSQSWRTSEATCLWDLELSSLTLPAWGGLHDGELSEHPTPELATSGLDCSSLPTPNAADGKRYNLTHQRGEGNPTLLGAVHHLPTPTVDDASNLTRASGCYNSLTRAATALLPTPRASKSDEDTETFLDRRERIQESPTRNGGPTGMPLGVAVALLPTPAVNDMGEGKTLEWWDDWAPRQMSSDGRPAPHGRSLAIEAQRMLPTPRAQNGEERNSNIWERPLDQPQNLENALARIGATTGQRSAVGKPSSDDQPHRQLSLDGLALPA
jgi:hypothetical protein